MLQQYDPSQFVPLDFASLFLAHVLKHVKENLVRKQKYIFSTHIGSTSVETVIETNEPEIFTFMNQRSVNPFNDY
jgi:hypothetical protein